MSNLNIRLLNIDTDRAVTIAGATNDEEKTISFVRGNEYVLQANCYANSYSSVLSTFEATDTFALYIGRAFQSNASPVVEVVDISKWNNVSDWTLSNVLSGHISCRVNVSGSALDADLGNLSSQSYHMEIVLVNNSGGTVLVTDTNCAINNAVQK